MENMESWIFRQQLQKKMKTLFLCCFVFLSVSVQAAHYSQEARFSISLNNVPITEIFSTIQSTSKFTFIYSVDAIKGIKVKSLAVKDATVQEILDEVLQNTRFAYKIEDNVIVIQPEEEQIRSTIKIQGYVYDTKNNPLPGVTVRLAGVSLGTTTNVQGWFSMNLPVNKGKLEFSFVGFKKYVKEFNLATMDTLRITLEEDLVALEEVVVSTGYYNVDKRHLTSSVTSKKMEDIMQPGVSTLDQMLEGQIPGLIFMQNSGQVGAAPKIKIRGTTTILGNTSPLWVLDGVILSDPVNVDPAQINDLDFVNLLGNAISGLNPEDIERIDVLKDASATAIYGPKASNGVIVITTKKGKAGPPSISYSVSGTFRRRPRYTDQSVHVMNSLERTDLSKEAVSKKIKASNSGTHIGYEAAYEDFVKGIITSQEFAEQTKRMSTINTDWLDLLLQDTYSHSHTLSISGGSSDMRYYASAGYSTDKGNQKGEESNRYSGMIKVNINRDKYDLIVGLNGSAQERRYTPSEVGLMSYALNTARNIGAYNNDGSLMYYQKGSTSFKQPFSIINEVNNTDESIQNGSMGFNINLTFKPLPSLKTSVQFSYNLTNQEQRVFFGEDTWYAAKLRMEFLSGGIASGSLMPMGGELRFSNMRNRNYSARANIDYHLFLDKNNTHQLSASLIGELSEILYTGFATTRRGYFPDRGMIETDIDFPKATQTSAEIAYPAYDRWLKEHAKGIFTHNLTRQMGLIAVLSYLYRDDVIINANARIDGSNKFGHVANEKLNPIWSASARWNIHESLLKDKWWANTIALKLSFGYQGNMPLESPELIIQKQGLHTKFNEFYSSIKGYPNPDLKWEKTSTWNVELEFSLFNNKLTGNFSYYNRFTKNAFLAKEVSWINGSINGQVRGENRYIVNSGSLRNQGFEFDFNFTPIGQLGANGESRGFTWRINPNFGSVFNQLIDKLESKDKVLHDEDISYSDFLNGNVYVSGRPINSFYSYKFTGLDSKDGRPTFYGTDANEIVGTDKNGNKITRQALYESMELQEICYDIMEHSGCREPFLQGSISNYFGWKNWGLSFSLAYSIGSKIRLIPLYGGNGNTPIPAPEVNARAELVNRWKIPGDEKRTNIPGILDNESFQATQTPWWQSNQWFSANSYTFAGTIWSMYDNSDVRVVSGNYLKMTSLSLRYIIPQNICQKMRLKSAYVNIGGTNLFTVCSKKLKGQDPSQSGSTDLINISVRPTYTIGLNVTF